jgi:opacity protein-like surface antigen
MKTKLLSLSIITLLFISANLQNKQSKAQEADFIGLLPVFNTLDIDIATKETSCRDGVLPDENFTVPDETQAANGPCVANALRISRATMNKNTISDGFKTSIKMTTELFKPLLDLIGLGTAADFGMLIISSDNPEEFVENVSKYVADKIIDKSVDEFADGLKDVAGKSQSDLIKELKDKINNDETIDLLKDKTKEELKKAYDDYFKKDRSDPMIEMTYDPGLSSVPLIGWLADILTGSKSLCPVTGYGNLVTHPDTKAPYLKIIIGGSCACKWPVKSDPKLKSFLTTIWIKLDYTYNSEQKRFIFAAEEITYEVKADCDCEEKDEDCSYLDQQDMFIGLNGGFGLERENGDNTTFALAGLGFEIPAGDNFTVGADFGIYQQKFSFKPSWDRDRLFTISPNVSYYTPCCFNNAAFPYIRLGSDFGFGSQTFNNDGTKITNNINQFGFSLQPGLSVPLNNNFSLNVHADIVSFTQKRVKVEGTTDPVITNNFKAGLSGSMVNLELRYRLGNNRY